MNTLETELTPAQAIDKVASDLGLTMTADFIPFSQSRNRTEKHPSLNWIVTLHRNGKPFLTTDYSAGCAHAPSYKQGDRSMLAHEAVKWECEHGKRAHITAGGSAMSAAGAKPLQPGLRDVLYSLATDSSVLDSSSFEEWASDFGYETDSRKAEILYRACLNIALKMRNALGETGLQQLREACQDY